MSAPTLATRRALRAGIAAVSTVVIGLATGCGPLTASAAPAPAVVAADLALTGPGAALGAVFRQALQLRVGQVNQQRLLGDRRLELQVSDNRSDPATAAENLAGFAADPAVTAIVSGGCAACVVEAADAIDAAGVPTIALAAGDEVAAPVPQRRFIFQLAPVAADNAELLVGQLDRAGLPTLGLVTGGDDGGGYAADGARELAGAAQAAGLDLVVHERIAGSGPDAVAAVTGRLAGWRPEAPPFPPEQPPAAPPGAPDPTPDAAAGPAAVVLWTPPAEAAELAASLRATGWEGELFLDASAAGSLFLPGDAGAALSGATLVFTETLVIDQVIAASPAKTARQVWWREYVARYQSYDAHASFAADAVGVLVAAVNRSGGTDREALRDTILATNLDGLSGPIRFTPDNHSGLQPLALTVLVAAGDRWRLAG